MVAAAGCIAGSGLAAALRLPDADGCRRPIVLQRGHATVIDGVPLLQLLRLAGGAPVEVGTARTCAADELAAVLTAGAAAGLFVAAEASEGLVDLPRFLWACRQARVPSIVLCGPALGPLAALDAGADLALVDPALVYDGPSAGLIAGGRGLVAACKIQERGLGGLFRLEPATLAAIIAAIEAAAVDIAAGRAMPDPPCGPAP